MKKRSPSRKLVDDAHKLLFVLSGTKGLFITLSPHLGLVLVGTGT